MNTIAILYHSDSNGNTLRLLKRVEKEFHIDLIDSHTATDEQMSKYWVIGFASGIFNGRMHQSLFDYVESGRMCSSTTFVFHTSGKGKLSYNESFVDLLEAKGIFIGGTYHCKGFGKFGLNKYFGGISKKHPDDTDIEKFKKFLSISTLLFKRY